jgi:hypothetical protein
VKTWLKGFAAAMIGGVVASTAQAVSGGNVKPAQLKGAAIAGALLTVGAYLTKSPVGAADAEHQPKK